ncbi:hypothetical protein PN441_01960 [Spirulina major CS-329]|nr:hypothetical protein [Spirulina subsalsa]MDB9494265.1 hypothetical protein [Spirulina subsalsa CS-330]MDB9501820.1 hypothetical protein [Spirulina major CS-329]
MLDPWDGDARGKRLKISVAQVDLRYSFDDLKREARSPPCP